MLENLDVNIAPFSPGQKQPVSSAALGPYAFRSVTADFVFRVNGEDVFEEQYWNIGELAMQLTQWLKSGMPGDFYYDCIDSEETTLFTFRRWGQGFQFYTEWDEQRLVRLVERPAVADFIGRYSAAVKALIEAGLGFSVAAYLP